MKLVKKKHKPKERRVLAAAKTDVRVHEAVIEFVQRRNNMKQLANHRASTSRLNYFFTSNERLT